MSSGHYCDDCHQGADHCSCPSEGQQYIAALLGNKFQFDSLKALSDEIDKQPQIPIIPTIQRQPTIEDLSFDELEKLYASLKVVTEEMEDAGAYHNHKHNSVRNMILSYQHMLDYHPVFKRLFE
jgi:hypothetical protein